MSCGAVPSFVSLAPQGWAGRLHPSPPACAPVQLSAAAGVNGISSIMQNHHHNGCKYVWPIGRHINVEMVLILPPRAICIEN